MGKGAEKFAGGERESDEMMLMLVRVGVWAPRFEVPT